MSSTLQQKSIKELPDQPRDGSAAVVIRSPGLVFGIGFALIGLVDVSILGNLPIRLLLKTHLHVRQERMSLFFAISGLAWYVKPLMGILSDRAPLFGTRRRHYLVLSSLLAAALWLLMGAISSTYAGLLAIATAVCAAIVMCSTVLGGLLVEAGQANGATGRLSALKMAASTLSTLAAGPIGGFLATKALGWTGATAALLLLLIASGAWTMVRERPFAGKVNTGALNGLKEIAGSRSLWWACLMAGLVLLAPGFQTPLFYYQTSTLKFSTQFIGFLAFINGLAGVAGGVTYFFLCRRLPLRRTLALGIVISAA
ncbi:MAG TPA: MFS transporter, partial [Chthonomonadales bacterium]|nr:MFS transporter [Chthonomonadales bacterium]